MTSNSFIQPTMRLAFVFVTASLVSFVARAQDAAAPTKTMGWSPSANLGANAAISSVSDVVGQTDGTSENYGLNLNGAFGYVNERSDWQNKLNYNGSFTKTPVLPTYVKSGDLLKYESLYRYSLESLPSVGPYARVSAEAPIFVGQDVRANDVTYSISRRSGATDTVTGSGLRLTDGFKPLTTKESIGFFWKAYDDPKARVDFRLGAGAQQIAADGQLAISGAANNGTVSVVELRDLSQLGLEAAVTAKGQLDTKTGWELGVESLTPFISNKPSNDDRDPLRLTNIDGVAKLSSSISDWASLTYTYKVLIKPQLVDRTQQTHLMALNINYNLL